VVRAAAVLAGPLVSNLRYVLLAVLALAAAAILAVALVTRSEHPSTAAALPNGKLLAASADLFPQSLLFGQPVHVRIDAVVDHRKLDPRRVRLDANWSPYTPLAPMTESSVDVGNYTRLHWQVDLHCLDLPCAPQIGSAVRNVFQPTTVHYVGHVTGSAPSVTVTWPSVIAWSRLDAIDQERKAVVRKTGTIVARQIAAFVPPWHVDTTVAAVSYRIGPSALFWAALAGALVLMLGAALCLRPWLPAGTWLRRPRELTKVERALAAVERARGKPVEERKALELLAAELRSSGEPRLAWTATELAWSPAVPEPERTSALADDVRRELVGRTNGHRA
jgi:hypothetical protein